IFPRNLAALCNYKNTPLIHVTTDCTYTGKKGIYNEKDYYDADDLYGISKNCGDIADCMTLRTSFIGPEKGTKRSLLEWTFSQKGKTVNGFTNHRWNGISTVNFARIAEKIMLDGLFEKGIFHIFSTDTVTKHELLTIFNEIFSLGMTINPIEGPEFCDRSLSSIHPLSGKVSILSVAEQVKELKEFFEL
ncbi:MAG TPA: sugar nucleotide-binding protein, partial [Ignavibacteria bacterium]